MAAPVSGVEAGRELSWAASRHSRSEGRWPGRAGGQHERRASDPGHQQEGRVCKGTVP